MTKQALGKLNDPQVHNCVAVTVDSLQILVSCMQSEFVEAFQRCGVSVLPDENEYVLSRIAGKLNHVSKLQEILLSIDEDVVFAYGYGM